MSLEKDILPWQEPMTGAVSCELHPVDYSCDNGVAFTAEYYALLGKSGPIPEFDHLLLEYEGCIPVPGVLYRHPSSNEVASWDDHLAAAAMSPMMAARILAYGEVNDWEWGGKWLGRFPIFIPTVRAGAGKPLSLLHKLLAASCYLVNSFEGYEHTSGKISLWLASKALYGEPMKGFNWVIKLWRYAQLKRYKGGLREVMGSYFPPKRDSVLLRDIPHPFSIYAPETFD